MLFVFYHMTILYALLVLLVTMLVTTITSLHDLTYSYSLQPTRCGVNTDVQVRNWLTSPLTLDRLGIQDH